MRGRIPTLAVSGSVMGRRPTVILDAGHGGFDGGAVASDGTVEKEINLKIALKLKEFLRLGGTAMFQPTMLKPTKLPPAKKAILKID